MAVDKEYSKKCTLFLMKSWARMVLYSVSGLFLTSYSGDIYLVFNTFYPIQDYITFFLIWPQNVNECESYFCSLMYTFLFLVYITCVYVHIYTCIIYSIYLLENKIILVSCTDIRWVFTRYEKTWLLYSLGLNYQEPYCEVKNIQNSMNLAAIGICL